APRLRSRCSSCRARRFSPINARWRKTTAAPTARRCSASAGFPRTTTSATFWTRRIPRCCSLVSNAWRRCSASRRCGRPSGGWAGRTLIAWDGTEFFCSQKLGCPHCLTRKRANGKTESYHSMLSATVVALGHSKVVPLMPEFIAPQDGAEKQDCERNAAKRWFGKHGARLAPLRPVFLGDDLFACHPVAKMVKDAGADFIFTCKPTSHKALYDFIDGTELRRHEEKVRRRNTKETFRYRWIEAVPLRDGKDAILVNWIGFEIFDAK